MKSDVGNKDFGIPFDDRQDVLIWQLEYFGAMQSRIVISGEETYLGKLKEIL